MHRVYKGVLIVVVGMLFTSTVLATNSSNTYCQSQDILIMDECLFLNELVADNDLESLLGYGPSAWCASSYVDCDDDVIVGLMLAKLDMNSFPFGNLDLLTELKVLDISGNSRLFASNGVFDSSVRFDSASLTNLILKDNALVNVNWINNLELPNLSHLSLKNNLIEDFSKKAFKDFPLLTSLDISHNDLSDLDFLKNIPDTIQYFDVSYNKLKTLEDFASLNFLKLQSLELSYNELIDVSALADSLFPELHYLFLDNNHVKDFSPLFEGSHAYYFVRLHDNDYQGYFPIILDDDFSYDVGRIGLQIFYGNSICGRFPQEFVDVLDFYPLLVFFHDYSPKALVDIDFLACENDALCLVNEDCQSEYCAAGVCRPKAGSGGVASESGTGDKEWLIISPEQADRLVINHDKILKDATNNTVDVKQETDIVSDGDTILQQVLTGAVTNTGDVKLPEISKDIVFSPTKTTTNQESSTTDNVSLIEEIVPYDDESVNVEDDDQEVDSEEGYTVPEGTIGSLYWTPNYLYAHGVLKPLTLKTLIVIAGERSQNGIPTQPGVISPLYSERYNPDCIGFSSLSDDLEPQYIQGAYKCLGGGRSFPHYYSHFTIKDFVKQFSLVLSL